MKTRQIRAERPKATKREIDRVLNRRTDPYNKAWSLAKLRRTNMTALLAELVAREFREEIARLKGDRAELDRLKAACLLAGIEDVFEAEYFAERGGNGTESDAIGDGIDDRTPEPA